MRMWAEPGGRRAVFLRRIRCALAALLLLPTALAACAPHVVPAGPPVAEPRLLADSWLAEDGLELPLRAWLPEGEPRAIILALHGFNDYSNAFAEPGAWWAERGIATYAYDQRGFGAAPHRGLWVGSETLARDLRAAADLVRARHPGRPLFLLGESMGAAVLMVALAEDPGFPAEAAILSAPAVWARSTMPGYQRVALEIAAGLIPWAHLTGEGVDVQASDNIEMLRALGRDPLMITRTRVDAIYGLTDLMDAALASSDGITQPVLLLYGEKDEVIPREPTLLAWQRLPDGSGGAQRLALYEHGWHLLLRDLEAETVLRDIAAWIDDRAAPLPSGADRHAEAALAELAAESESESGTASE